MSDIDIVERLKDWSEYDEGKINDTREEAADEITKLRAENERLKKALADQSWKAEYDRVMNPETGRDGWL